MENGKTFMTKTGFCHVLPDRILLTRNSIVGNVASVGVGNNISRILIIYGLLSCLFIYEAYGFFVKSQLMQALLVGLLSLYLMYGILRSLNNSATPIIYRDKIREVIFKKAIPGLTRSRFEIKFEDEQGKIKKRLIPLPGLIAGGSKQTEQALKIMTEEKLL